MGALATENFILRPKRQQTANTITAFTNSPNDPKTRENFANYLSNRYNANSVDIRQVRRVNTPDGISDQIRFSMGSTNNPDMPRGEYAVNILRSHNGGEEMISLSSPSLVQQVPENAPVRDGMTYTQARNHITQTNQSNSVAQEMAIIRLLETSDNKARQQLLNTLGFTNPQSQQALLGQFEKEREQLVNTMERSDTFEAMSKLRSMLESGSKPEGQTHPTLTRLMNESETQTFDNVVNALPPDVREAFEEKLNARISHYISASGGDPNDLVARREAANQLKRINTLTSIMNESRQKYAYLLDSLRYRSDDQSAEQIIEDARSSPGITEGEFDRLKMALIARYGSGAVTISNERNPLYDPKVPGSTPEIPKVSSNLTVGQLREFVNSQPNLRGAIEDTLNRQQNVGNYQQMLHTLEDESPQEFEAVKNYLTEQNLWGSNSRRISNIVYEATTRDPNAYQLTSRLSSEIDLLLKAYRDNPDKFPPELSAVLDTVYKPPQMRTVYLSNGEAPITAQIMIQPDRTAHVQLAPRNPIGIGAPTPFGLIGDPLGTTLPAVQARGVNVGMSPNAYSIKTQEINANQSREVAYLEQPPQDVNLLPWYYLEKFGTAYHDGGQNYGVIGFHDREGRQVTYTVLADGTLIDHQGQATTVTLADGTQTTGKPRISADEFQKQIAERNLSVQNNQGLMLAPSMHEMIAQRQAERQRAIGQGL